MKQKLWASRAKRRRDTTWLGPEGLSRNRGHGLRMGASPECSTESHYLPRDDRVPDSAESKLVLTAIVVSMLHSSLDCAVPNGLRQQAVFPSRVTVGQPCCISSVASCFNLLVCLYLFKLQLTGWTLCLCLSAQDLPYKAELPYHYLYVSTAHIFPRCPFLEGGSGPASACQLACFSLHRSGAGVARGWVQPWLWKQGHQCISQDLRPTQWCNWGFVLFQEPLRLIFWSFWNPVQAT